MVEQLHGAATATVVVLGYVLLVECLTAATVLLAEFVVRRVRALWGAVGIESPPEPASVAEEAPQVQTYRIGGGLMRW